MKKIATTEDEFVNRRPFFARFLESQELEKVAGGQPQRTTKYPSDNDEAALG